ncbi:MAG: UvrD-helicase domain-containing protein, partial [Microgenomates group bacterium]
MSILSDLNPAQKQAVTYKNGHLLVLAGAGSGKTRVLTHRVAYVLAEKGVNPENVLLLTFTNKAADEMKKRVAKLVGATPTFSGTFHSFCVKVLRINGDKIDIPKNFLIYDEQDTKEAIKEILGNLNLSTDSYKPNGIVSAISEAKSQMITPLQFGEIAQGEWQEQIFKIYLAYEKFLKKAGALDFDDLLLKSVYLFKEKPDILSGWQRKLTHIFVDEWQDTNKVQYELTKLIVGTRKNLTVVGDAAQSIYGWRGADHRNITYLMRDFPNIKVINLERNYRSTQNILSAANSVISKNTTHPVLKLWTKKGKGEKIKIYRAKSGLDEASFIVGEIGLLINKGFDLRDVAVLYRTNAQSRVLEEALLHAGIPYTLI